MLNHTNINLLLTEREGRTGEYWPEVVAVRTERSEVRTKTTEGQYSPVRLEQARLVSSLLYGTRVMLVSKLPAFENKKYTSYDHFHGNGPYGKIPTKKEPIRTPGFTPRLPCHIIKERYFLHSLNQFILLFFSLFFNRLVTLQFFLLEKIIYISSSCSSFEHSIPKIPFLTTKHQEKLTAGMYKCQMFR